MNYLRPAVTALLALVALLAVFWAAGSTPAYAATFTVTKTDDTADGACDADCSLREAIIAATATRVGPDTITVPAGTYILSIPGTGEDDGETGDLDIGHDMSIIGEGSDRTIIDGAMLDRIFHILGPINVDISGVTIRNGNAVAGGPPEPAGAFHGDGGGILFEADGGGGLTVSDVTVSRNFAEGFGGGIANDNKDHLTVTNSTVSGNTATAGGGGIYSEPNAVDEVGRAFVNLTLTESTITGNTTGGTGGGVFNEGMLTINNSTVSGNTAGGDGGGIFTVGTLTLTNSTVSGNTAADFGGGIVNNVGTASLKNTIVANNTAAIGNDCNGMINSNGYNLDGDGTCSFTATGDLQNTDPLLGPLADNGGPTQTHALLAGSPAIEAGSPDCPPPATDQRGVARPQGAACDIGAFEHAPAITVNTTDDELNADGDCSLREAIQAANTDAAVDACTAGTVADTITVPAGTYTLSISGADENANGTGDLDITADLTLIGAGAATTIVDGAALDRVFHIPFGVTVEISGLTIRNGSNVANGGGIFNDGTLTLNSSTVSGNTAGSGGGIFTQSSSLVTVTDSTVSGNTAGGHGGGIHIFGTLTLNSSTVSGNTAGSFGGGIYNGGTLTLSNSTVSANTAANDGGGIHTYIALTLNSSTVAGNTAGDDGGGVSNDGTLTLNSGTVSGNAAGVGGCCGGSGGGIFNSGSATLTNLTISDNTATGSGGSIHNLGDVTLTDSTVSGNTAGDDGGGIFNANEGTLTLTNSTVSGNTANSAFFGGGGIYNGGTLTLSNSTVSANTADAGGGIINAFSGTLTLTNSTVSGNAAGSFGGIAIFSGTATLKNTIVANSTASSDCSGTITSAGYNLDSDGTCGLAAAGDISGTDPLLGPLADNGGPTFTHSLLAGSPAIEAGSPDCPPPATDQRGVARPQGTGCDIGAYELEGSEFTDVRADHFAVAHIQAIFDAGITAGCATDPPLYCPDQSVTRAQMAVFIILALNDAPVGSPAGVFDDVPPSAFAAGFIEKLAELGITAGCGGGNYCPDDAVTRAQMAVFIVVALEETPVASPTGVFDDVPSSHFAAGFIEKLAELGITAGCGGGNYCPDDPVTRAQMAVFIVVAFNLPLPP